MTPSDFRGRIADLLVGAGMVGAGELLEVPPDVTLGDFALPCFSFAKERKQAPAAIASEMASQLEQTKPEFLERITAAGPYVNFFVQRAAWSQAALSYNASYSAREQTVLIEYSSPNIGKPFGIHHLRTTMIGNALQNVYRFAGYAVVRLNHLGDWGSQYGKLIVAFKLWGDEQKLADAPIQHLLDLYVRFHKEAKENPSLEEDGRTAFAQLEQGNEEYRVLWKRFRDLSLTEFQRIYDRLGVSFDNYNGEAFYEPQLPGVVDVLKEKGLLEESEGAHIVRLDEKKLPPSIILRSDGATLYATRDIAAAMYRQQTWHFEKLLYVVDARQSLHFEQLFAVLEKMELDWADRLEHVKFGLMSFPDGSMSTREGKVVFMEDVLDKAHELALQVIAEKNPSLPEKDVIAEQIGIGAMLFHDLKNDRVNDVTFSWDEMLSFEGETGPYLQYTHARIRSILRNAVHVDSPDASLLVEAEEVALAKELLRLDEVIAHVIRHNKPHILARHLLDIGAAFNKFYQLHRVLHDDAALQAARVALVTAVAERIRLGLSLLGIAAPEEM